MSRQEQSRTRQKTITGVIVLTIISLVNVLVFPEVNTGVVLGFAVLGGLLLGGTVKGARMVIARD